MPRFLYKGRLVKYRFYQHDHRAKRRLRMNRELTNRRLLHDAAVRLRDMLIAHAFLSTCQLCAKVDDVGKSHLPAKLSKFKTVSILLLIINNFSL